MKTDIGTDANAQGRIADEAGTATGAVPGSDTGANEAYPTPNATEAGNAAADTAPPAGAGAGADNVQDNAPDYASDKAPDNALGNAPDVAPDDAQQALPATGDGTLATVAEDAADKLRSKLFSVQKKGGTKRLMIYGVEFVYLYVLGICAAFLGWLAENVVHMIIVGNIDSRYHLLPFISPYALVVFAFHIAVGDMDRLTVFGHRVFKKDNIRTKVLSNAIILLLFCCLVFFGELAVGNLWDKCFGVQLWNYIDYPLHLTRYASVVTALEFGGGCYILFRFLYTPALKLVRGHMNFKAARIICCTLGIAIVLDTCWMMLCIMIFHSAPMYWSIRVR